MSSFSTGMGHICLFWVHYIMWIEMIADRCRVVTSINRNLESRDVIWWELVDVKRISYDHIVIIGNVTVDGLF
ncbi:hypothetical protein GLOIN_2v1728167 [Rhizophagus irregularis DAOM 181602=DAOM 197198]|nr:hypothetical protein GLOIN_2v1728167 [Rhizophagus irregularis DAOM 181602=DAOM 197198]